jgi:hypothetical protein
MTPHPQSIVVVATPNDSTRSFLGLYVVDDVSVLAAGVWD